MKVAIINCFDTYGERVENVHEYFVSRGHEVCVIVSDFKHFAKIRNDEKRQGYIQIHVPEYQRNLSVDRLKSHVVFAKKTVEEIEKMQPELIYALIPPNSLVKELSAYRKRHAEIKLIYDVIDLWPETMPIPVVKKVFPFTIWKNLRDKYIRDSDYVITECDLYQMVLKTVLNSERTSTIHWVRREKAEKIDYVQGETLDVCYLGSVNNIVDIDIICKVLKQLSESYKVIFHIIGKGENKPRLLQETAKINVEVIDHGTVYDKKAKRSIFSRCDFGLNIMKKTVCVGLTMKSIDYFEAGLPVINNIPGDTADFVEAYGIGINIPGDGYLDMEKVKELLTERDSVRENVYELYKKMFSYDGFVSKMDEILKTIEV